MTTTLEPRHHSLKTTDGATGGFEAGHEHARRETALAELTRDLSAAVGDVYWAYTLQGEMEDALDTALLREAMDDPLPPVGSLPVWAI